MYHKTNDSDFDQHKPMPARADLRNHEKAVNNKDSLKAKCKRKKNITHLKIILKIALEKEKMKKKNSSKL